MDDAWFSAADLAAANLPGLPTTKRNIHERAVVENWPCRARKGRGGGLEYPLHALPMGARAALALQAAAPKPAAKGREELWAWFATLPEAKKAKARAKLDALQAVDALMASGLPKVASMQLVGAQAAVQMSSIYGWERAVAGVPRADWLPALAPRHTGAHHSADCTPEAWDFIKADFLRPERPSFTACHRRLEAVAAEQGWTIPAGRTLERRLLALPEGMRVLARDGAEKLKRLYPAQARDRGVFHALEAVNADGHRWDVFVKWPDGEIGRPLMVAFQDLYSGKMLSWRVDRTENREAVRLAFGDVVEGYGIPDHCWLDNGRNFAAKWLTGGTPNRYRFKLKDDEPTGIMTQLGVAVHWTTPYAGQSKPIERAFRDFAGDLAKHPAFAGAYVGNNPMAKPANYGNRAVPIETFLRVLDEGVAEHNARIGRRSTIAQGRSFDATFTESYAQSPIRRATAEQRRLWLLAAEGITAAKTDGALQLLGNRYWAEFLLAWRSQKLVVRFDPQALQDDLQVYRPDGAYLGAAACIEATGFNDVDAARRHNQDRKAWMKGVRLQADAERRMSIDQVAALLPKAEPPEPQAPPKIVRLANGPEFALAPRAAEPLGEEQSEDERLIIASVRQLRLVRSDGDELA